MLRAITRLTSWDKVLAAMQTTTSKRKEVIGLTARLTAISTRRFTDGCQNDSIYAILAVLTDHVALPCVPSLLDSEINFRMSLRVSE